MSKSPEQSKASFIKVVGISSLVLGILFVVAGITTYALVSSQLRAENITVSADADWFAGSTVAGPFTAYSQAEIINTHALAGSEGTYSELGGMIREAQEAGDEERAAELQEQRNTMMNASFLRASLFTSVLAFGVSAMVIGLGVLLALIGIVIRQLSVGFQPKTEAVTVPATSSTE